MKLRGVFNVGTFIGGFAAAAIALSHALPPVRPPQIAAKLDWLAMHGEQYDTIFIGSSRVHRQIIPDLFDSEMAAQGIRTNSFNLSGDGMRPPEDEFVLEKALSKRTAPLRILLVECNPLDSDIAEEDAGTSRAVYWHDAARMARLWRKCWASTPGMATGKHAGRVWKRLRQFPSHILHWIWNEVRAGQGNHELQTRLFGGESVDFSKEVGMDGFRPPRTGETMSGSTLRSYEKQLASALRKQAPADVEDTESQASLAWKKALADRLGAKLVVISSPFLRPEIFVPQSRDGMIFLDYSSPLEYPELYSPENRRDPGHLNIRGSEIYTRLVARQIAAALNPKP